MLAPSDGRFSYLLAAALVDSGDRNEVIGVLDASLTRQPNDVLSLPALARYLGEAGQNERAAETRRKVDTLLRE